MIIRERDLRYNSRKRNLKLDLFLINRYIPNYITYILKSISKRIKHAVDVKIFDITYIHNSKKRNNI